MKTTTNPKGILSKKKDHKDLTNKGESVCFKLVVAEKFNVYESYCLNYQLLKYFANEGNGKQFSIRSMIELKLLAFVTEGFSTFERFEHSTGTRLKNSTLFKTLD